MSNINTVEKVIALVENIPESIVKHCMLFVMRDGITPMWEDPNNRTGGAFSFKVANRQVPFVWKDLLYSLCGETLIMNDIYTSSINGITISPKKNFCIIKIWMATCNIQDPSIITPINLLSKQGCLFKAHEPEF